MGGILSKRGPFRRRRDVESGVVEVQPPEIEMQPQFQILPHPHHSMPGTSRPLPPAHVATPMSPLDVQAVREYFTEDATDTLASHPGARVRRILNRIDYTGRLGNITRSALGGFSDVMRGQIQDTGETVAIKTLRAINMFPGDNDYVDTTRNRLQKRMARELLRWFDLRHPHILPLVGFAFIDSMPCLLSMWCENGNVAQYIIAKPSANRTRLVHQVALGLNYLHSKNVIHADMKPLNILVDGNENVRICDFGASKRPEMGTTGLTTANIPVHTVLFSPPEIFLDEPHEFASDVYSFACVMLEVLTGLSPFWYFHSAATVIAFVSRGDMPSRSQYPELPNSHWILMTHCWASNPADRPSMAIVIAELEELGFGSN